MKESESFPSLIRDTLDPHEVYVPWTMKPTSNPGNMQIRNSGYINIESCPNDYYVWEVPETMIHN